MRSLQILFLTVFALAGISTEMGCYSEYEVRPACRSVFVPARRDYWGRWHPAHWRCV